MSLNLKPTVKVHRTQVIGFTSYQFNVNLWKKIMKPIAHYTKFFTTIFTSISLAFVLLGLSACQQNDSNDQNNPPEIPPQYSMSINSDFPQNNTAQAAGTVTIQTTNNFTNAAANVLVGNAILVGNLLIPVAAFLESFNHFPTLRSDNTWVWTYAVRFGGVFYTAELHAQVNGDEVDWNMYVTKPGEYLDFNWFSGVSARDGSMGTWTLRKDPTDSKDYLDIEWTYDKPSNTGTATYTNVLEGSTDKGSYISYGTTTDLTYDAFYDIYSISTDHFVQIEWNRTSHTGRINNPDFFQNPDWHYWDENLQDIAAP